MASKTRKASATKKTSLEAFFLFTLSDLSPTTIQTVNGVTVKIWVIFFTHFKTFH